ncbi:hypothetical protein [Streptomyces xanthochromogenes]
MSHRARPPDAQQAIGRPLGTLGAASAGDTGAQDAVVALTGAFAHCQELIGRALENDAHPGGQRHWRTGPVTLCALLLGAGLLVRGLRPRLAEFG